MKILLILLLLWPLLATAALPDEEAITATLYQYIDGTAYHRPDEISQAFFPDAVLYLEKPDMPVWMLRPSEYAALFKGNREGTFNGRVGEILSLNIEGEVASAKVEILLPERQFRYIDLFLLKKIAGEWKIISKTAAGEPANSNGKRILFIVSNAAFHGDTTLPAGVSFSEIVYAYNTFKKAGYTVDFLSPEGGEVPLVYINMSLGDHKDAIYNTDLMYALAHTKAPAQTDPSRYAAVHYVGGSNAMYGVADNEAIQAISMAIYEEHNGLVSSVCHGTAGITSLKTSDGSYLVSGKRIAGYPEDYEMQDQAYFKAFPLLIRQTVEKHGGEFTFGERGKPHVAVDGRVVTGQNHLSSALVAEKMIEILNSRDRQE